MTEQNTLHLQILKMRKAGSSINAISLKTGISSPHVSKVLKQYPLIQVNPWKSKSNLGPKTPKNVDLLYTKWGWGIKMNNKLNFGILYLVAILSIAINNTELAILVGNIFIALSILEKAKWLV